MDLDELDLELVEGGGVGEILVEVGAEMELEDFADGGGFDKVGGLEGFASVFGHDEIFEEAESCVFGATAESLFFEGREVGGDFDDAGVEGVGF